MYNEQHTCIYRQLWSLCWEFINLTCILVFIITKQTALETSSAWWHNMPPTLSSPVGAQAPHAPPNRRNVAVLSQVKYVPTLTAAVPYALRPHLKRPGDLDLWSRMTWAISMPIFVFLGLSVLELGPMYATDRQSAVRQKHRLMPPPIRGGGIKMAE